MPKWIIYALLSMLFAGVTSVIAKMGLKNVSADTGLAIRTIFVFIVISINALIIQKNVDVSLLTRKDVWYLCISGLTTSLSWIFYYRAIKIGEVSQVALIDKASILITLALSFWILNEPFSLKTGLGAGLILCGLVVLILK